MSFKNIQMPVVRRKDNGQKIKITEITEQNRYDGYECIICGTDVVAVAVNNKKVDGKNTDVTPHFKHKSVDGCNSESLIHYWMKTELIGIGDSFKVVTNEEKEYICSQIFYEKSIEVNDRKYIPDVTIITTDGETIYFEMKNTNGKNIKDYIEIWKSLNNIVVEVDVATLYTLTFNALYYEGKYFNLSETNKVYLDTIEKYKSEIDDISDEYIEQKRLEIEKLDYIWDEVRNLNFCGDFNGIAKALRGIKNEKSRVVAIDLIKKTKCNLMLQNYINNQLNKVNKRLKMLNLKHNGYMIKYETKIPRLIYDRIYKGIEIWFYSKNIYNEPFVINVINDRFTSSILSDSFKKNIDKEMKKLKEKENLLKEYLNIFINSKRIKDIKYGYEESTDYINSIYFKDYRNKTFVLYNYWYDEDVNSLRTYIDKNTIFLPIIDNSKIVIETDNGYEFKDESKYIEDKDLFRFDKFVNQDKIVLTFKKLNKNTHCIYNFDFNKARINLEELFINLDELSRNKIKLNANNVIYRNSLYSKMLNDKIKRIINPILSICNKNNTNEIIISLDFKHTGYSYYLYYFKNILNKIGINTEIY